jgi:hypothetical protein
LRPIVSRFSGATLGSNSRLVTLCKYNADITIKDFDEGKETLQAKRRRMLQFCPENVEVCALDGFFKSHFWVLIYAQSRIICIAMVSKFHQYVSLYMQMECPMTDGLLESLEVNLDFSSRFHHLC